MRLSHRIKDIFFGSNFHLCDEFFELKNIIEIVNFKNWEPPFYSAAVVVLLDNMVVHDAVDHLASFDL